jgi:predicted metal-dependent phosphoesterase TrpH
MVAVALTDHDTIGGVAAAIAEGERRGVEVIAGCEFSVKVAWGEMHLLGYFLPLDHPEISGFLERERAMRLNRARQMVESLQAWGVDIADEDVMAEAGNAAVGRPHVARALVRLGKVADVPAAFDEFLGQGRRAYVEKVLPSLPEVAELVHRAGGIVSAAHLKDRANRAGLQMLKADGLDGVEVRHPRHSAELQAQIEEIARLLGLVRTGGTDWHGPGHDDVLLPIGACGVPMEWLDAMREARPGAGPADPALQRRDDSGR